MKKTASKREPLSETLQHKTSDDWDTFKAQLLAKISSTLDPKTIEFDNFTFLFIIPRVISKPGVSLKYQSDYELMITHIWKPKNLPTVNIIIQEKQKGSTNDSKSIAKENGDGESDTEGNKNKKKKVSICMLYNSQS